MGDVHIPHWLGTKSAPWNVNAISADKKLERDRIRSYGGFLEWGVPPKWMVYIGKSY